MKEKSKKEKVRFGAWMALIVIGVIAGLIALFYGLVCVGVNYINFPKETCLAYRADFVSVFNSEMHAAGSDAFA